MPFRLAMFLSSYSPLFALLAYKERSDCRTSVALAVIATVYRREWRPAHLWRNGKLIKRPFVLLKDRGLVGFKEDEWKAAFK